jgi:hypothetical protein
MVMAITGAMTMVIVVTLIDEAGDYPGGEDLLAVGRFRVCEQIPSTNLLARTQISGAVFGSTLQYETWNGHGEGTP